ncbi:VanZ family protein [Algoriphagus algorifonticola]|uniref:VanZ family protein n=1 Tax=Algoriphagus algorifonticola TaxID=2593007 RepID=UPI0011A53DF6|nr:VanZ family protein [Algoriphagus algorifonticola]
MRLVFAISWLLILAIAMLTPGDKFPEIDAFDFQDKLIHVLSFAILAFLWAGIRFQKKKQGFQKLNMPILLGFVVLPSFAFELGQLFVPNRSFDVFDLIVNQIGVLLGILAYFKTLSIQNRLD